MPPSLLQRVGWVQSQSPAQRSKSVRFSLRMQVRQQSLEILCLDRPWAQMPHKVLDWQYTRRVDVAKLRSGVMVCLALPRVSNLDKAT